jgi:hypothetical protein
MPMVLNCHGVELFICLPKCDYTFTTFGEFQGPHTNQP